MPNKRYLSLWFPRLAAERLLRLERGLPADPFAVVEDQRGAQVIASLNGAAQAAGLTLGQTLRDARAMCPGLVSRPANLVAEASFLTTLRRWAGKFTPWVGEQPPDTLVLDVTGCAHLFGGEEPLAEAIERDCIMLGLSVRIGIADTLGAAWALARFSAEAGQGVLRSGDDIDQEARATRSRAGKKRHWTRGGAPPRVQAASAGARIAPAGQTRQAIGPLPVAALRLDAEAVEGLTRLGLRRIEELFGTPRAGLARRFGRHMVRRLDQALGIEPEPVSPARPPPVLSVRLRFPEPIGLEQDFLAAFDKLLPELSARLERAGRGARRLRAEFSRADHTMQWVDVGLARPLTDPHRMQALLAMKLGDIDAGFGVDQLRIVAIQHEKLGRVQHSGHADAMAARTTRDEGAAFDDLLGRLGTRLGLEAMTRLHPAQSHIPEKGALTLAAAFSAPATGWRPAALERPLRLWRPEPVMIPDHPTLPGGFRWRGRDHDITGRRGPERIAPEWWFDDESWRSGIRDYWIVTTDRGARLWLYYAHGAAQSAGWFCHGAFA